MASIVPRKKRFCVVYTYVDAKGKKHQKWETCRTMEEAKKRKMEIEYSQMAGTFTIPKCSTLRKLLDEYVELYGCSPRWTGRCLSEIHRSGSAFAVRPAFPLTHSQ